MRASHVRLAWAVLAVGLTAGVTPAFAADPPAEDPDVAAAFKAKGWGFKTEARFFRGDRLVTLRVFDAKTGKSVTLTADDHALIARAKTVEQIMMASVIPTEAGLRSLSDLPRLKILFIGGGGSATDAGLKALAGCKTLEEFGVTSEKVTDAGVRELAALPKLRELGLFAMNDFTGSAFEAFAGSKTLEVVSVTSAALSDVGIRHLAAMPNLRRVHFNELRSGRLTTAGIRAMIDVRMPTKLDFAPELLDDDLFLALVAKGWLYGPSPAGDWNPKPATAADVERIDVSGSKITDRGFAAVASCVNTEVVNLAHTGVTDESVRKMAGFRKLTALTLASTKVTGPGLDAVAGHPLKHLCLAGCALTEDAFAAAGRMTKLDRFDVSEAKFKADWFRRLAGMTRLRDVDVQKTDFDDGAARVVAGLSTVEQVYATDTRLTDAGFAELLKLPKLRTLYVRRTAVTAAAVQQAKKDHPKVSISH